MGRDVFDGMTRLKQLHILKAIFKCVLFLHNKTPKVFCLTFGVHFIDAGALFYANAQRNYRTSTNSSAPSSRIYQRVPVTGLCPNAR